MRNVADQRQTSVVYSAWAVHSAWSSLSCLCYSFIFHPVGAKTGQIYVLSWMLEFQTLPCKSSKFMVFRTCCIAYAMPATCTLCQIVTFVTSRQSTQGTLETWQQQTSSEGALWPWYLTCGLCTIWPCTLSATNGSIFLNVSFTIYYLEFFNYRLCRNLQFTQCKSLCEEEKGNIFCCWTKGGCKELHQWLFGTIDSKKNFFEISKTHPLLYNW